MTLPAAAAAAASTAPAPGKEINRAIHKSGEQQSQNIHKKQKAGVYIPPHSRLKNTEQDDLATASGMPMPPMPVPPMPPNTSKYNTSHPHTGLSAAPPVMLNGGRQLRTDESVVDAERDYGRVFHEGKASLDDNWREKKNNNPVQDKNSKFTRLGPIKVREDREVFEEAEKLMEKHSLHTRSQADTETSSDASSIASERLLEKPRNQTHVEMPFNVIEDFPSLLAASEIKKRNRTPEVPPGFQKITNNQSPKKIKPKDDKRTEAFGYNPQLMYDGCTKCGSKDHKTWLCTKPMFL